MVHTKLPHRLEQDTVQGEDRHKEYREVLGQDTVQGYQVDKDLTAGKHLRVADNHLRLAGNLRLGGSLRWAGSHLLVDRESRQQEEHQEAYR